MEKVFDWENFKPHRATLPTDGEMAVLSRKGDTKVVWDPDNRIEVENAKQQFEFLIKKGFTAFKVKGKDGEKGEQIREFDPHAGRIILAPQIAGGR